MEWQAVVFALQIMLLTVGWMLFQKARAELNARAVEAPVLAEVKALQRSVKSLIADLERTADEKAGQLESRTLEARAAFEALEAKLLSVREAQDAIPLGPPAPSRARRTRTEEVAPVVEAEKPSSRKRTRKTPVSDAVAIVAVAEPHDTRRSAVYDLADAGQNAQAIAQTVGISEGEVETLLGIRARRQ